MNNADVEITQDNRQQFIDAMHSAVEIALEAIGLQAVGYAQELCPVDTGRLRNSLTHAVVSDEKAVYIGTNVEYAAYVELGTSRSKAQPYLKPAVIDHKAEYQKMVDHFLRGRS